MRSGRWTDSAPWPHRRLTCSRAVIGALKHPAAGVRKVAAMVLPKTAESAAAIVDAGLLRDPDLHTRLAATLAIADMPQAPAIGEALYAASQVPENYTDRWLSRALFIADTRHRDAFLALYKADPAATPMTALPLSLRLGGLKPDWRVPPAAEMDAWQNIQVPGNWETRGLPDFDGVVWFTRTFTWSAGSPDATIALGRIGNTAEVWVNGLHGDARRRRARPPVAARRRTARLRAPRRHAQGRRERPHRPHHERAERRRLPRPARGDARGRGGAAAGAPRGTLEVPRRAADQRGIALREARRAERARGPRGRRRRRGRRARGAAATGRRRRPTSCCASASSAAR